MQKTTTPVKFGAGSILNVLAQVNNPSSGLLSFGYDNDILSGIIVANGKIVSSKILDVSIHNKKLVTNTLFPEDEDFESGYQYTLNITYADKKSDIGISSYDFEIMEPDAIIAFMKSFKIMNDIKISDISTRLNNIENNTIDSIIDTGIEISKSTNTNNSIDYKIKLNIDNNTIKYNTETKVLEAVGYKYNIILDEDTKRENIYRIYKLLLISPSGKIENAGEIEIPSNQILKDANLVKAIYNEESNTYTEILKNDEKYNDAKYYIKLTWNDSDLCDSYINISSLASTYWEGDYININSDGDHTEISVDINTLSDKLSEIFGIDTIKNNITIISEDIKNIKSDIEEIKKEINDNILYWDNIDLDYN